MKKLTWLVPSPRAGPTTTSPWCQPTDRGVVVLNQPLLYPSAARGDRHAVHAGLGAGDPEIGWERPEPRVAGPVRGGVRPGGVLVEGARAGGVALEAVGEQHLGLPGGRHRKHDQRGQREFAEA